MILVRVQGRVAFGLPGGGQEGEGIFGVQRVL